MSEPSETVRPSAGDAKAFNALDVLRTIGAQLLVISDAQFAIWKMKLARLAALAVLIVPLAIGFLGLAVYGFILLDQAAAAAMKTAQWPEWVSPLVRGGVYTLFVVIKVTAFWRQNIGSADTEPSKESHGRHSVSASLPPEVLAVLTSKESHGRNI